MGPDLVDDEAGTLERRLAIARNGGSPFGDNLSLVDLLELAGVRVVVARPQLDEPAGRGEVELDPPVVVPFPEVEGVSVDRPPPLLGGQATVAGDGHPGVRRNPGGQSVFVGLLRAWISRPPGDAQ